MEDNKQGAEALKKIKELAESIDFCMLTTLDSDHKMSARPMSVQEIDDNGTIWFFTSDDQFGAQSADGDDLLLSFASPAKHSYLTINGKGLLVKDGAKMKELWKETLKAWFPQGLETPGIALLKVTPDNAHYWDSDATRIMMMVQYAYAKVTGNYSELVGKSGELSV
ncbi:MAG: hypothetical protein EOP52_07675 [Sphingobacteriales bacterium]|nr:MAG: hypothetical protein EOP52_07675 [Sphingobacteriales bacterium]